MTWDFGGTRFLGKTFSKLKCFHILLKALELGNYMLHSVMQLEWWALRAEIPSVYACSHFAVVLPPDTILMDKWGCDLLCPWNVLSVMQPKQRGVAFSSGAWGNIRTLL